VTIAAVLLARDPASLATALVVLAAAAALVLGPLAMALTPAVLALALGRVPHA
jgi:hypothetical protein